MTSDLLFKLAAKQFQVLEEQGRSHAFESEGAQSPKAILGPFSLKKWEGPSLFLLLYGQKSGGAQAPRAPYIDYGPVLSLYSRIQIKHLKAGP